MFKSLDNSITAVAPASRQSAATPAATSAAATPGAAFRTSHVVDSSSQAAADVTNLFARFGSTDGALRYREIHSDADAAAAAARWPLLADWLALKTAAQSAAKQPDHRPAHPNAGPHD